MRPEHGEIVTAELIGRTRRRQWCEACETWIWEDRIGRFRHARDRAANCPHAAEPGRKIRDRTKGKS